MTTNDDDGSGTDAQAIAAHYTDNPREAIRAIRPAILDEIADGLDTIGLRGGIVDILRAAAADQYDANERDGIPTDGKTTTRKPDNA